MVKTGLDAESAEFGMKRDANTTEQAKKHRRQSGAEIKMQSNKHMRKVISMLHNPLFLNCLAKKVIEM